MENRRATGPDQNVVNLACAECCAWADQVETLRKQLQDTDVLCDFYKKEGDFRRSERDRARAEVRDLERENASLRRRLREGGR
jgi:hypothetical protein